MLTMGTVGESEDSIFSSSEDISEDHPDEESVTTRNVTKRPRRPSPTTVSNATPSENPPHDYDYEEVKNPVENVTKRSRRPSFTTVRNSTPPEETSHDYDNEENVKKTVKNVGKRPRRPSPTTVSHSTPSDNPPLDYDYEEVTNPVENVTKRSKRPSPTTVRNTTPPEEISHDYDYEENVKKPVKNVEKRPQRPPFTVRNRPPPEESTFDFDYNENTQTSFVEPIVQQVPSSFGSSFSPPRITSTGSVSSSSLFFQPSEFVSPSSLTPGIVRPPQRFSAPSQPSLGTCHYVCQLSGGCGVRIQATGFTNHVS